MNEAKRLSSLKTILIIVGIIVIIIAAILFFNFCFPNKTNKSVNPKVDFSALCHDAGYGVLNVDSSIKECSKGTNLIYDVYPTDPEIALYTADMPTDFYYDANGKLIVDCGGMPTASEETSAYIQKKCAEMGEYKCSEKPIINCAKSK